MNLIGQGDGMDKNYKAYECPVCGCEFAIYMPTIISGKYVTCPMDGRHTAREAGEYDDLCDCMKARKYRRNNHGAIEQDG